MTHSHLCKVKVTYNGVSKTVEVVGSGDLTDKWFVKRIYREAGVDMSLKKFDESKFSFEVVSKREVKGY